MDSVVAVILDVVDDDDTDDRYTCLPDNSILNSWYYDAMRHKFYEVLVSAYWILVVRGQCVYLCSIQIE